MLLTVDIGNTNIKMGLFDQSECLAFARFNTQQSDYEKVILEELAGAKIDLNQVQDVIVSCVVPVLKKTIVEVLKKHTRAQFHEVNYQMDSGIVIDTENPKEVGSDLIVMCAYAYHLYKRPLLAISFGTATAMCYVDEHAHFKYAIIAPGLDMSARALWKNAAQLPSFNLQKHHTVLTNNTIDAMNVGIIDGHIGAVEYLVNKVKKEVGIEELFVVASGGMGKMIVPHTDVIDAYVADFVTEGLAYLYTRSQK